MFTHPKMHKLHQHNELHTQTSDKGKYHNIMDHLGASMTSMQRLLIGLKRLYNTSRFP